jgi:hypothetical protein
MAKKEIGRREFLRLLAGTAAAAGLSHFRFLNVGGAPSGGDQCGLLQSADGYCSEEDLCAPTDPDGRDTCWPSVQDGDPDVCATDEVDVCMPPSDPDECTVAGDPDYECATQGADSCGAGDPDLCWPEHDRDQCLPPDDTDDCSEASPDACGAPGDPDYKCIEGDSCQAQDPDLCAPERNPDECGTVVGDPDYGECDDPAEDLCIPDSDPDLCSPQLDPDELIVEERREEFVPEPGSMGLLASGLMGLAGYAALRWRSRDKAQE